MTNTDELVELRAERLMLLRLLNRCSNSRRQRINKRLMSVSQAIQRLTGVSSQTSVDDEL